LKRVNRSTIAAFLRFFESRGIQFLTDGDRVGLTWPLATEPKGRSLTAVPAAPPGSLLARYSLISPTACCKALSTQPSSASKRREQNPLAPVVPPPPRSRFQVFVRAMVLAVIRTPRR
jgi:hypothetical protein